MENKKVVAKIKKETPKLTAKPVVKKEVKKTGLTVNLLDISGKSVGEMELPKEIFGVKPNKALVAQAVRVYLANQKQGRASTKTRGEVRGGGRKPWRQKGTGRARAGSTRSPHWRGGGVVHGPQPRDLGLSMPKKMRRAALISALSGKFASKEIVVLNKIEFKEAKTKLAAQMLKDLGVKGKNMVVLPEKQASEERALKNLKSVRTVKAVDLNTYEVLNYKNLLLTKSAVEKISALLLGNENGSN